MNTPYLPVLDVGHPYLVEHLEFWRHCNRGELRFQRCADCSHWRHPPSPLCPACRSSHVHWQLVPERAELFSYTVVHHAASPALQASVPYNVAIVAFESMGDLRLVSNVIDAAPDELRIGLPLHRVWQRIAADRQLPLFSKHPPS